MLASLTLNTLYRFYIEKITFLKENTTVELFFLNAKSLVFNVSVLKHVFIFENTHRKCGTIQSC